MKFFQTKTNRLSGTSYSEVSTHATTIFHKIKNRTKRRPYIRSTYFSKEKIFFDYFWDHLAQKSPRERFIRLKYFRAAIDVLEHSRHDPSSQENPHKPQELLHRFAGITKDNELFYVQVKADKRTERKFFMSCFPEN